MTPACFRCTCATEQGWWGPPSGLTHCRACHRDWPAGSPQIHCVTCCAHFSTPRACDLHLTATGCRPPGECVDKSGRPRLVASEDKHGPIWRRAGQSPWDQGQRCHVRLKTGGEPPRVRSRPGVPASAASASPVAVGEQVRTAPSVRPLRYAGRTGVVREARPVAPGTWEIGVEVGQQVSWFRPAELVALAEREVA